MISGKVVNREALVEIEVEGPSGVRIRTQAVLDTGYNGHLTLSAALISQLRLPSAGYRRGTLADGSVARLSVHMATIVWHGRQREVLASQTSGTPLIGMALLEGSRLILDAREGGEVSIDELRDDG